MAAQTARSHEYDDAFGRAPTCGTAYADLIGKTVTAGVYRTAALTISGGTVTLDGEDQADAVFIFQTTGAFTAAASTTVTLTRGAQACKWELSPL